MLRKVPLPDARQASFEEFRARHGQALEDWAAWCALAEVHGPDYRTWPVPLRDPRSRGARSVGGGDLAAQAEFHAWVQWLVADAGGGGPGGGSRRRHGDRHHRRPRDRRPPRRRGRLGRAGVPRPGLHRRRPAGRLQPARPGLGPAPLAPAGAGGRGLPAPDRPVRRLGFRGSDAVRGRRRSGWAAAGASTMSWACPGCGGSPPGRRRPGRLRLLRRAGHARHPGGRRGPRPGRSWSARISARSSRGCARRWPPGAPGHPDAVVRARLGERAARRRSGGGATRW